MVWTVDGRGGHGAPKGLRPHLVIRLKPGWRYDSRRRRFVAEKGGEVVPGKDLPRGARVVYQVPELAKAAAAGTLSEDEERLARYLHLLLPTGADPSTFLAAVREWDCVEEVRLPPEISLPGAAG